MPLLAKPLLSLSSDSLGHPASLVVLVITPDSEESHNQAVTTWIWGGGGWGHELPLLVCSSWHTQHRYLQPHACYGVWCGAHSLKGLVWEDGSTDALWAGGGSADGRRKHPRLLGLLRNAERLQPWTFPSIIPILPPPPEHLPSDPFYVHRLDQLRGVGLPERWAGGSVKDDRQTHPGLCPPIRTRGNFLKARSDYQFS